MSLSLLIQAIKKITQKQMGKSIVRTQRDGRKAAKAKNRKEGRELNELFETDFPKDRKSLHEGKKSAAECFRKPFRENGEKSRRSKRSK